MAAAAIEFEPPREDLPSGTCRETAAGSPLYWVRGSSGWYLVSADTGECTCSHYLFRCAFKLGETCKHGRWLTAYLEEQKQCPVCRGKGWLLVSGIIRYVDRDGKLDLAPKPCVACCGSGRRGKSDAG